MAARSSTKRGGCESTTPPKDAAECPVPGDKPEQTTPLWLLRSAVYQRLALAERMKLDRAILLRPPGLRFLKDIAERFDLTSRHGISMSSLRTYARRVEEFVRPEITAQVLAGVLGCLPQRYRRHVAGGGQVLLLSRVLDALEHKGAALSVAELARLASVLASMAARSRRTKVPDDGSRRAAASSPPAAGEPEPQPSLDPATMARTVRLLYGLPWPPESSTPQNRPEGPPEREGR